MVADESGAYGFDGKITRRLGGYRPPIVYRRGLVITHGPVLVGYTWPDYANGAAEAQEGAGREPAGRNRQVAA